MAQKLKVYAISADVTSSLGMSLDDHWQAIAGGKSGIAKYEAVNDETYWGAKLSEAQWEQISAATGNEMDLSAFERLCVYSASKAIKSAAHTLNPDETVFILSTTKGNVEWLNTANEHRTALDSSAELIAKEIGLLSKPVVVSHACVSGSVALLYAQRLLTSGRFKHAIVTGCDRFTPFVLSGFQSFQAIADGPCRPFDANRTGINLGEAAATIILSTKHTGSAMLLGGATSNDANHISGPSRTGAELSDAVNRALAEAGVRATEVSMVSAHGTATAYNDEMEAKALNLSGLSAVPLHSMKSYTGHTLGAAGVLESAMVIKALEEQQLIPSANFETLGVPVEVNVTTSMQPANINYVLKTASGFGGSNAAIVWGKS